MPNYKLHLSKSQEEFSLAWLHTITAAAGYAFEHKRVDADSIDAIITQRTAGGPRAIIEHLSIQLKCTYAHSPKNSKLIFPLKVKNFNDLSGKRVNPRILVVLHVPRKIKEWLIHSPDNMVTKNCAYWTSLHKEPETTNKSSVNVPIPTDQRFTVSELVRMMNLAAKGKFQEVLKK